MDLSTLNFSTILTLAIAMALAYVAIKIFSNIIVRIVCLIIGIFLLITVINKFGVSIPMLSEAVSYGQQMFKEVMNNLNDILSMFKSVQ